MKSWRCELTGLSKVYNLYFVADVDTIRVYQPSFPDQSLSDEVLVLHPPVSVPGLRGYIDPHCPHSITRLHVDYLGREEIILVTCDDGDVIGYRVQEIQQAIEDRRPSGAKSNTDKSSQVRVFLHRNVGKSAWGLAVHREARLIAISANTRRITVIAYALVGTTDSSETSNLDDDGTPDYPTRRQRDHVITCSAQSNIPSVSFDNSGRDPSGRWMFSSCIDGRSLLWALHQNDHPGPILAQEIFVVFCAGENYVRPVYGGNCGCSQYRRIPHAIWATLFLDPQSFHQTYRDEETFEVVTNDLGQRFWELKKPSWQKIIAADNSDNSVAGEDVADHTSMFISEGEEEAAVDLIEEDPEEDMEIDSDTTSLDSDLAARSTPTFVPSPPSLGREYYCAPSGPYYSPHQVSPEREYPHASSPRSLQRRQSSITWLFYHTLPDRTRYNNLSSMLGQNASSVTSH